MSCCSAGRSTVPPADGAARTLATVDLPPWLLLCIGPVAPGADGLRLGIQGALEARDIARHPGRGSVSGKRADIVTYDAVGVVALMLRDVPRLIRFVKATLGDLAKQSRRNEEVRSTLVAFLLHGRSRKKAAEILHVAPNTVAYRVEQAQSLMPRTPDSDLLATLLALRVLEILPNLHEVYGARTDGDGE
jgi:DNA-binding PucR family transcriptional regulator